MASIEPGALLDFAKSLESDGRSTGGTKLATVVRVDGEQAYVKIPGGVDETPVATSGSVLSVGDTVSVSVQNGKLRANANVTNPSAGILKVQSVENKASTAYETSIRASEAADFAEAEAVRAGIAADSAQASATTAYNAAVDAQHSATNASEYASRALGNLSTVQSVAETLTWITQHGTMTLTTDTSLDPTHVYFVRDANGDYEVGSYKYSIVPEPNAADLSTYYVLSIDESLNNYVGTHLALTGEGLWLLPAATNSYKVLIATGAGSTYTTAGTYILDSTGGVVGKFTSSEVSIGDVLGGNYAVMDTDSFDIMHATTSGGTTTTTEIAHFGYGQNVGGSYGPSYTLGKRFTGSGSDYGFGNYSVVEGYDNIAYGYCSHAEGRESQAKGYCSHAEGLNSIALGDFSHAEGKDTEANDYAAHAEGHESEANGQESHAQNLSTIAAKRAQTTLGTYNVEDTSSTTTHPSSTASYGTYAVIVGNGTSDNARSNALTVDWNGNVSCGMVNDSGWQTLGLEPGWSAYTSSTGDATPKYRKVNGLVEIRGAVKPDSSTTLNTTNQTFATLPTGYWPSNYDLNVICQGSGVKVWTLTVDTNGNVQASRLRTMNSTSYQATTSNEWLVFDVTFFAG